LTEEYPSYTEARRRELELKRCSWADAMTGRTSIPLGYEAYRNALEAEGMSLVGTHRDEVENHYYFAQKT
jgi:hypothetical protein